MWDQLPGPRISQPPIVQDYLLDDEDGSGILRFVHRRSPALVLIVVVVVVLAVYLVISLT